jgi:hypothetical protein
VPPQAASIYYYQSKRHIFGDLKVEVYDADGELISTLPGGKRVGMNRVDWPMRLPAPKLPAATNFSGAFQGPRLPEGDYTFKVIKGKETFEGTVSLVPDPRSPHSAEDRAIQQKTALEIYHRLTDLTYLVESVVDLKEQADARADGASRKAVKKGLEEYSQALESFRSGIVSTAAAGWLSGDEKLREHLGNIFGTIVGYEGRPTATQMARVKKLLVDLTEAEAHFAELSGSRLDELNGRVSGSGADPLVLLSREQWEAGQDDAAESSTGSGRFFKPKQLFGLDALLVRSFGR